MLPIGNMSAQMGNPSCYAQSVQSGDPVANPASRPNPIRSLVIHELGISMRVDSSLGQRDVIRFSKHQDSSSRTSRKSIYRRLGTAATVTAVALPLLVTLVFGAIELANAVFLRQSVNMAAYEAAKVITRPGSNEALARTRCAEVLSVRKVSNFTLTFSPTVTTATPRGTQVTVTVVAPASNLTYGPVQFMSGKTITSTVVMVRL